MIPGISDRNRLPRLGKIRLGDKAVSEKSGREYPRALDHFNFVDVPELEDEFGDNCSEIRPIVLPSNDEEVFLPTARKAYTQTGLFCSCSDGETAMRVCKKGDKQGADYIKRKGLAVDEGDMFEMPCAGEDCPVFERKECKNIGRFFLMTPDVPRLGVYEITTTSRNSIINILSYTRMVRAQLGSVSGVPFVLKLGPQEVQGPDGKGRTVQTLTLEYRGSLRSLTEAGRALQGNGALALLAEDNDPVPDDLMPNGGHKLDAAVNGEPKSGRPRRKSEAAAKPEPAPKARRTRKAREPKPTQAQVRKAHAETAVIHQAPEPEQVRPEKASGNGSQEWTGFLNDVMKISRGGRILYTLIGQDGTRFGTFSESMAKFAHENAGTEVVIEFSKTARGKLAETIKLAKQERIGEAPPLDEADDGRPF